MSNTQLLELYIKIVRCEHRDGPPDPLHIMLWTERLKNGKTNLTTMMYYTNIACTNYISGYLITISTVLTSLLLASFKVL